MLLKHHFGRNTSRLSREGWFPLLSCAMAQISRLRRFRVAPLILAAILPALLLSPACGTPTEPQQANCIEVSIVGTFANAAGLATIVSLRLSPDEGDALALPFPGGTASVPVAVSFRFQTRAIHTLTFTVVEQTSSPNTYNFSGDSIMAVVCTRRVRETMESRTTALATGESMVYQFDFTRSILDPPPNLRF